MRRWWAAVVVTLVVATVLGTPAPAGAVGEPGKFFDGAISYSSVLNCPSVIMGNPYQERGAGVYVGFFADPDETPPVPSVNQTVYIRVVAYGLGNSCSGQRFFPGFQLPAGVEFDPAFPILCFANGNQTTVPADCPQWGNVVDFAYVAGAKGYQSTDSANANTWPLPQGANWEFRFPVRSSTVQSAANLQGYVKMFDGNSSPLLAPRAGLYVFGGGAAAVLYDSPSTTASPTIPTGGNTRYGLLSEGQVATGGAAGWAVLQRGTASGAYESTTADVELPTTSTAWRVFTDWNEPGMTALKPRTRYFWRLGFDPGPRGPAGGSVSYGAEQSFLVPESLVCAGARATVSLDLGQLPTEGRDVVVGTAGADSISAGGGNDVICGGGGNDTLNGGAGNDTLNGGAGTDMVTYAGTAAAVKVTLGSTAAQPTGGAGTDTVSAVENLTGGAGADTLTGSAAANVLIGGAGNDRLAGAAGNDTLNGGAGNDNLNGGAGTDTVTYAGTAGAVKVTLGSTAAQPTGGAGTDTVAAVENLTGGAGADTLTGNAAANSLSGAGGNDRLAGAAGNDAMNGGAGNDNLNGGAGADTLNGSAGNDVLNGAAGSDTVTYAGTAAAVKVTLGSSAAQPTGGAGVDTVTAVENLGGGNAGDTLTGNGAANKLSGAAGNATLSGAAGNDAMNGGAGTDRCNGGAGTDTSAACEARTSVP
jgi:Ca2+-binding RTX toxin-like protein